MKSQSILDAIDAEIAHLQKARRLLADVDGSAARRSATALMTRTRSKRRLSAEARAKISQAQKKRWAAVRKSAK